MESPKKVEREDVKLPRSLKNELLGLTGAAGAVWANEADIIDNMNAKTRNITIDLFLIKTPPVNK